MRKKMMSYLFFLLAFNSVWVNAQKLVVHYLPPAEELAEIKDYNLRMLRLALETTQATYGDFEIVVDENKTLTQQDALRFLSEKKELYVVPTMTDANRERVFIPVRVPLYKGLFGIRLLIGSTKTALTTPKAGVADAVKSATLVQGKGWPDTQILKENGYKVIEMEDKGAMIQAVSAGVAQFYPRSLAEIWPEIQVSGDKNLMVNPDVYLYYPTAIYFFVQKTTAGKDLAGRLQMGLEIAVQNGSFNTVFNELMGPMIQKAALASKKMIRLQNPALPPATPVKDSKYWFIQ